MIVIDHAIIHSFSISLFSLFSLFIFFDCLARASALNTSSTMFNFTRQQMIDYESNRPWVKEEDRLKLIGLVEDAELWLNEKVRAQSALQAHEEPAYTSAQLYEKLRPIAKLSQELMKVKKPYEKPKPKVVKVNANSTNANESSSTGSNSNIKVESSDATDSTNGSPESESSDNDGGADAAANEDVKKDEL